jgi:hypothetical protein
VCGRLCVCLQSALAVALALAPRIMLTHCCRFPWLPWHRCHRSGSLSSSSSGRVQARPRTQICSGGRWRNGSCRSGRRRSGPRLTTRTVLRTAPQALAGEHRRRTPGPIGDRWQWNFQYPHSTPHTWLLGIYNGGVADSRGSFEFLAFLAVFCDGGGGWGGQGAFNPICLNVGSGSQHFVHLS